MSELELELTYLAKTIPKNLKQFESKKIVDIYFPKNDPNRSIRLRQNGARYELTKKKPINENDFSIQIEETINLTKEEFKEFLVIPGAKVEKTRYKYTYEGKNVEVDIFDKDLKGLVIIDFEFTSEEEKDNFIMPDFCLVEVTQEMFIAGGTLAGKTYKEIESNLNRFNYKKLLSKI